MGQSREAKENKDRGLSHGGKRREEKTKEREKKSRERERGGNMRGTNVRYGYYTRDL